MNQYQENEDATQEEFYSDNEIENNDPEEEKELTPEEALARQVKEYEQLLQETLEEKKSFGNVQAGPFVHEDKNYYRVSAENASCMVYLAEKCAFTGKVHDPLEVGTEVIMVGQAIMAIVPHELVLAKETPEFDLIDWNEVGGLKSQLAEIKKAVELPIANEALAKQLGLKPFTGVLLYGPPGCGKTLIAKAIASTILKKTKVDPAAFTYVKGAELLSMYVGQTEQHIKTIFKNCREYTKTTGERAVLFIDEAEAILPVRGSHRSSDVDKTIVPTFLSEMSGFEGNNPIMILSTNLKNNIDPAILREGRIDLKIEVKRPDATDAVDIFEIHLKKLKCVDKLPDLAAAGTKLLFSLKMSSNVSGAMIEAIAQQAGRVALDRLINNKKDKKVGLTISDLEASVRLTNTSYDPRP